MTSALTDWVRALCGAAVICAAAMALCPDGRVKRVLRLVCGLVMACALLSPVLELDFDAYSSALSGYGEAARAAAEGAQEEARLSSRGVIEEECAAYILDKAEALGLAGCSADCSTMWQIGVDVLAPYRRQGIASALTSGLAVEALRRGLVPFYCCAWANVKSARNAWKSGFRPEWVQLTAKLTLAKKPGFALNIAAAAVRNFFSFFLLDGRGCGAI